MKTVLVGHFSPLSLKMRLASSAAGNQVQRKILQELADNNGSDRTECYAMLPCPAWPRGHLFSRSQSEVSIKFIGYLNLPLIKHIIFSMRLMMLLIHTRPKLVVQYNSYLFENLILLFYKRLRPEVHLSIVIQDVHVMYNLRLFTKSWARSTLESASIKLSKLFDTIVPISEDIIRDFNIRPDKCFVFQGGVTEFGLTLMEDPVVFPLEDVAVFAGALEPYNGVDRLIKTWLQKKIQHQLHIFGRGSLSSYVERIAQDSSVIIFHGFQPESVISKWQRRARWNICLRYNIGLNQAYFFPSKLFNILCAPGNVVVNDFNGLPVSIRDYLCILTDDLDNLSGMLMDSKRLLDLEFLEARRKIVISQHSWQSCINKIVHTVSVK